jgi:hypothetical protein
MSEESSKAGGVVLSLLSDTRIGRILLWFIAALMALVALMLPPGDRKALLILALLPVVGAMVGAFKERRRERSAFMGGLLLRVALAAAGLGLVALLLWLKSRGRKPEAVPPPPLPEVVDELAQLQLEEERVA